MVGGMLCKSDKPSIIIILYRYKKNDLPATATCCCLMSATMHSRPDVPDAVPPPLPSPRSSLYLTVSWPCFRPWTVAGGLTCPSHVPGRWPWGQTACCQSAQICSSSWPGAPSSQPGHPGGGGGARAQGGRVVSKLAVSSREKYYARQGGFSKLAVASSEKYYKAGRV